MHLKHFVINISQKCMSSADVWKYRDSVLGHEDCLAANSKSTGPPQKSADDRNCSVDSAVRPTSAEWQNADVDSQWLLLWVYNCPSSKAKQFHGDIDTWAAIAVDRVLVRFWIPLSVPEKTDVKLWSHPKSHKILHVLAPKIFWEKDEKSPPQKKISPWHYKIKHTVIGRQSSKISRWKKMPAKHKSLQKSLLPGGLINNN